jgi:hypothetical protein
MANPKHLKILSKVLNIRTGGGMNIRGGCYIRARSHALHRALVSGLYKPSTQVSKTARPGPPACLANHFIGGLPAAVSFAFNASRFAFSKAGWTK